MREILFRGKRVDNGEWITGYYAKQSNHACFAHEMKYTHFIFKDVFMDFGLGGLCETEVDPESVGQYTGLTDKNGKKIFEGDIVITQPFSDKSFSRKKYKRHVGVVGYCVSHFKNSSYEQDYEGKWTINMTDYDGYGYFKWGEFFECEVVGNIHDNPELLSSDEVREKL